MKTAIEKMRSEELTDMSDLEIQKSFIHANSLIAKMRAFSTYDEEYRVLLEDLIPGIPKSSVICPPFYCDHGHGIRLGEQVFVNANCTFLDGGFIAIGNHTLVGPCVQIYTPHHPINYLERRGSAEYAYPVTIGDDCWIGGGAIICPGVTIGNRCIIGAGSVVVKDVPDDSIAVGNPAIVKKKN
ncbi:MAG: sugar O-acetyltransferase [Bacteroides sp.]